MIEKLKTSLIDSNILVYAYDKNENEKHEKAKTLIKKFWINKNGILSTQNLVEFYSVITKKIEKPISIEKAKQILIDLKTGFTIITYNENTVLEAIDIQKIYNIHFWDALLIATMQENHLETIFTENIKDFKKIHWINSLNPFKI